MAATSYLASPSATRDVLERHGFYTKHRLGQNFLVSDSVIARIVSLAELAADDVVLEVGPGIGTLTVALLPRVGRVMAVEADRTLEPVLAETCARDSDKLDIVWGDALRQVPEGLPTPPTKFVSNLPYQVAATIILQAFETMPSLERAVVMVQAEVADRIAAIPAPRPMVPTRPSSRSGRASPAASRWGRATSCRPHTWTPPSCASTGPTRGSAQRPFLPPRASSTPRSHSVARPFATPCPRRASTRSRLTPPLG